MKAQGILPFMVSLNQTKISSNKLSPIHRNKTSLIKAGLTKAITESWKAKVSEANEWEILSALEDKIRIPKRPCNVLFIL